MEKLLKSDKAAALMLICSVGLFKLVYFYFSNHSLFTEEAQYWLWSKHLDWNYYSKPLMIAVYNFLSTLVFGDTEFAIKFNAVLFSALTSWVLYLFSFELFKNSKLSFWAVVILTFMPFFHLGSIFHTTDSSLYFFWVLSFYWLWKSLETEKLSWWILAGLSTAVGIMSKNIMLLVIPIVFLFMLLTQPKKILKPGFWVFSLASLIGFVPLVLWNMQNDFVTFKHVGTLGGVSGTGNSWSLGKSLVYMGEYVGGQLGIMSPFFIPLLVLLLINLKKTKDSNLLFLILPSLVVWVLFLMISTQKSVYVNWPAMGMLLLPIGMAKAVLEKGQNWFKYLKIGSGITAFLFLVMFFPQPFDQMGLKKLLKPKADPMGRLAGYRELGERITFLKDSLELENSFIFSDNYHLASEMAFYVEENPQTFTINMGRRKNQFDLWSGIDQFEGKGYTGIYLTREKEVQLAVSEGFDELLHLEEFYTVYRGDIIKVYQVAFFKNLNHIQEVETNQF